MLNGLHLLSTFPQLLTKVIFSASQTHTLTHPALFYTLMPMNALGSAVSGHFVFNVLLDLLSRQFYTKQLTTAEHILGYCVSWNTSNWSTTTSPTEIQPPQEHSDWTTNFQISDDSFKLLSHICPRCGQSASIYSKYCKIININPNMGYIKHHFEAADCWWLIILNAHAAQW